MKLTLNALLLSVLLVFSFAQVSAGTIPVTLDSNESVSTTAAIPLDEPTTTNVSASDASASLNVTPEGPASTSVNVSDASSSSDIFPDESSDSEPGFSGTSGGGRTIPVNTAPPQSTIVPLSNNNSNNSVISLNNPDSSLSDAESLGGSPAPITGFAIGGLGKKSLVGAVALLVIVGGLYSYIKFRTRSKTASKK